MGMGSLTLCRAPRVDSIDLQRAVNAVLVIITPLHPSTVAGNKLVLSCFSQDDVAHTEVYWQMLLDNIPIDNCENR
jgi:hypothetical protein